GSSRAGSTGRGVRSHQYGVSFASAANRSGGMLHGLHEGKDNGYSAGNHIGGSAMANAPQLRPLGETLGTEALGIDLSRPLDDSTAAWVRGAFSEPPVLVFRDQDLGAAELAAFGRQFGIPRKHALIKYRHADCPEVSWLTNVEADG